MADALDRLFSSNNSEQLDYSVEEQMDYDEEANEDLFKDMSAEAKEAFFGGGAHEIKLDEPITEKETFSEPIANVSTEHTNNTPTTESKMIPFVSEQIETQPVEDVSNTINTQEEVQEQPEPVTKPRMGRPKKKQEESNQSSSFTDMFIPVMNQLAKDLIDNLKQNKYKIARFDDKQMQILFDYMYTKF